MSASNDTHAHEVESEALVFQSLCERFNVLSRVILFKPPKGERGLFAIRAIKTGELVLGVPASLLLTYRSPLGNDIQSPWDAPHQDAKDTLLARQLLAAIDDDSSKASELGLSEEQRYFWKEWSVMLPAREKIAHPITLPEDMLSELQDQELARAAVLQKARVEAVLGDCGSSPETRCWAVAMCSSRPYNILLPESQTTGMGLASFIPFVDMANHAEEPNCEVQGRGDGSGPIGIAAAGLVAKRDIAANEEIFVSYAVATPNTYLFSRFGFVDAAASRHDRLLLPEGMSCLSTAALQETTQANAGHWGDAALLEATLHSLPHTQHLSVGAEKEIAAAVEVERWLQDVAERDFATTLEKDEMELVALLADSSCPSVDIRRFCLIQYRVQRKRLWRMTLDVIAAHINFQSRA